MLFIIGTTAIFLLAGVLHSLFDITQFEPFKIISPINESIWEHMKMMFYAILIWSVIEYFIRKNKALSLDCFWFSTLLGLITGIFLVPAIHYTFEAIFGRTPFIVHLVIVLIIALADRLFIKYIPELYTAGKCKVFDKLSIPVIILLVAMFTYFTFYPGNTPIFIEA